MQCPCELLPSIMNLQSCNAHENDLKYHRLTSISSRLPKAPQGHTTRPQGHTILRGLLLGSFRVGDFGLPPPVFGALCRPNTKPWPTPPPACRVQGKGSGAESCTRVHVHVYMHVHVRHVHVSAHRGPWPTISHRSLRPRPICPCTSHMPMHVPYAHARPICPCT